jgi:hypothetical protein
MTFKKYAYTTAVLGKTTHPDADIWKDQEVDINEQVVAAIMLQLSLKAGIERWGPKVRVAVHAEMNKLYMRDTFEPMHWEERRLTKRRRL